MNYDGCTVDYTDGGMDPGTGVFNVTRSGIYQLSFTAKYVAHNQVGKNPLILGRLGFTATGLRFRYLILSLSFQGSFWCMV